MVTKSSMHAETLWLSGWFREKLEQALHEAINSEDYERAAQVRDELRNLKPAE